MLNTYIVSKRDINSYDLSGSDFFIIKNDLFSINDTEYIKYYGILQDVNFLNSTIYKPLDDISKNIIIQKIKNFDQRLKSQTKKFIFNTSYTKLINEDKEKDNEKNNKEDPYQYAAILDFENSDTFYGLDLSVDNAPIISFINDTIDFSSDYTTATSTYFDISVNNISYDNYVEVRKKYTTTVEGKGYLTKF